MILLEIKKYFSTIGTANLVQVADHFHIQPDAMRGLLQHWIRKGEIIPIEVPNVCGSGCQQCAPTLREMYRFVEQ